MISVEVNNVLAGHTLAEAKGLLGRLPGIFRGAALEAAQDHLEANYVGKPNKLGGASTGYWAKVHSSARGESDGTAATVTLSGIGLRMKWEGGDIFPSGRVSAVTGKPIKRLAIPIAPEAHGKVPGMFTLEREGNTLVKAGGGGGAMFRLVRKVRIKPDRNIFPPETAITVACAREFEFHLKRSATA